MPGKVAVIGAGIGGIAVAVRMALKGYRVDVFEKNSYPGGKMAEIRHGGYRFDTGPSLFTLPGLVSELFKLAGESMDDHLPYRKLDETCRYFFHDGMVINAFSTPERFAEELQRKAGEDPARVLKYLSDSRKIFELTDPVFISNSLHLKGNYLKTPFLKAFLQLYRLKPFSTLHRVNSNYFRHGNTVNIFDRFATYNGSNPYFTPATLMVIPHLEHNTGAYFPEKGIYGIASALAELAGRAGVDFYYNCKVDEILVNNGRVSGVSVSGQGKIEYDMVVSDADIWFIYRHLLKQKPFPEKWFRHERSTSALIFYWGMKTQSENLGLHNILFAKDYKEEFGCLFNKKVIHDDPTVYLFISSKMVKDDAPGGCENWFVMINTPENCGQDWDSMITAARAKIGEKILRMTGIDAGLYRQFEFVMDPRGIEEKTASYRGSLYGNSSNSMFAAFRRHPNFSGIKGLYMVGGSVHPGGGIPLCLSSAKIVSGMIPDLK
ncbi:MAG: 1-hydroxycarotenoid 3,4-desaturase CrtD [Bacteroidales bacterium]|jgi:phytoene desaturase|nr:1-hydroxycarotenoid 3,4-desaturase CrtD [Bacteroidales bacterium]